MPVRDADLHVAGLSHYVDDLPVPEHCLFAAVVTSPVANGILLRINADQARALPDVTVITAQDIPGQNQIGDIVPDERLLADYQLNFIGKPVALVLAASLAAARAAAAQVQLEYNSQPAHLDVQSAYQHNQTFGDERQFRKGDPQAGFASACWVVEGSVDTPAQEHLYFETQATLAIPLDGHRLKLFSATQNPAAIQKCAARVLNLDMNQIEVEVSRLGGAFGGKEEQAKPWALLAALGAQLSQRPVKLVLNRQEDMRWTGKRHPYHAHYRLAADREGKLLAYDVQFLQDGGAVADLSTAILERTLFHATNAYAIPHVDVKAVSCRTHHPSNTAFRGFGAPQAIFTLECALDHLARIMQIPRWQLQKNNLLQPGYQFDYGMTVTTSALQECWDQLWQHRNLAQRMEALAQHNQRDARYRKAIALTPLCFGISFTATHLNQASVNVNIYQDGSVGIAISAVEMGQGVTEKIRAIAARCLDLPLDHIRIDFTNSSKAANMSATAASVGTDLNGMATLQACTALRQRLLDFVATHWQQPADTIQWQHQHCLLASGQRILWQQLIQAAYLQRISLVEHAHYATPDLYFDRTREHGHPFAYHVYGVSAIEATVDCLLGTYHIDQIDVVYDLGQSLDPLVDRGQMEGGLVQGMGYCTLEEILWNDQGHVITDRFATYKIPDLLSAPPIHVEFIASQSNPHGPFSAKAIGEPPFLLGLGSFFALADAMRSFTPASALAYRLPLTPERVLMGLYPEFGTPEGVTDDAA